MKSIEIGDVVGDYRVIEVAGSGGMGEVFKIEHVITKRIEALKLLPPASSSDPEQVQRFEREIQVQARLHHPNIVALYNAVRDGSSIGLVMEFVEGESLQRKLESGPLPVKTAIDYTCQVLRALAYAHEAGVIHRDVAPSNIIVTPDGIAKLMDFGLARGATDLRLSATGVPIGSPWYMSPEQVKAIGPMDARTDIYATGAVLREMLTGQKLFDVDGAFAVMRAHVEMVPAPPSTRNPEVPRSLDPVVAKAVAKDPALRFQSADEFRLAIEDAIAPIPAGAPAPPVFASAATPASAGTWLQDFRPSPAKVTLMLAPLMLVVIFARVMPLAKPVDTPVTPVQVAAPRLDPPPVPVAPQETPPAPAAPAPEVVASEAPRTRVQNASVAKRRRNPPKNFAIRVTGGDPAPPVAVPTPALAVAPHEIAEVPEPAAPETAKAPDVPAATPVAEGDTPTDTGTAKPSSVGSRLVRAIGKVNPFHKTVKRDPAAPVKTPLKQD